MSIKYRLTPVEVEKDGKPTTQYRPNALRGKKVSVNTHLIPDIAEQMSLSENLLRRFMDTMGQTVGQHLAQGNSVIFDKLFVLRPGLTGEFSKDDHKLESGYDGLRVNLNLDDTWYDNLMKNAQYEFVASEAVQQPYIEKVTNVITREKDEFTPGQMLQLLGRHLKFDPYLRDEKQNIIGENEDEGVFIASEQGEWQRLSIYSETGDKRVTALIPADIEAQELRLKVATRLKGEVVQEGTYGKFIKKSGLSLNGNGGDDPNNPGDSDSPDDSGGGPNNSGGPSGTGDSSGSGDTQSSNNPSDAQDDDKDSTSTASDDDIDWSDAEGRPAPGWR